MDIEAEKTAIEEIKQAVSKLEVELWKAHHHWYAVHDLGSIIKYTAYDGAAAIGEVIDHPF